MRQRNHALTLRLNDEELKHLKDQVVASGLTTQTFLRLLIAGQKIKPRRVAVHKTGFEKQILWQLPDKGC